MFVLRVRVLERDKTVFYRIWREDEHSMAAAFVTDLVRATVFPTKTAAENARVWAFSRLPEGLCIDVEEITLKTFDHGAEERAAIAFFASLPD